MACKKYREQFTHWINNELPDFERIEFESHLTQCPQCQHELQICKQVWSSMGKIAVPTPSSESMRFRFTTMLNMYKESEKRQTINILESLFSKLRQHWSSQPAFQLAYSVALLIIGVTLGYLFTRQTTSNDNHAQIASLAAQVQEMKQLMMLSLLENPSASERIRAVSYTQEIKTVNKQVTDALLATLNNDPNVNVRLMTLEALANYANDPGVREGLVKSINRQDSPLVQSAMADVMVKIQEKRSIEPFKKLLEQKNLNVIIRGKIEKSISRII